MRARTHVHTHVHLSQMQMYTHTHTHTHTQEYRTILYSQYRRAYNAGRDRDIGVPEWTEALHEWCGVLVAAAGVVSDRNFRLLGAAVGSATFL